MTQPKEDLAEYNDMSFLNIEKAGSKRKGASKGSLKGAEEDKDDEESDLNKT